MDLHHCQLLLGASQKCQCESSVGTPPPGILLYDLFGCLDSFMSHGVVDEPNIKFEVRKFENDAGIHSSVRMAADDYMGLIENNFP